MKRREFITLLGGAAAAWPVMAWGQQSQLPVVGFLNSGSPDLSAHLVRAFHQGLNQTGHFEGRNVAVEYRWAEGHYERLPALATDLVQREVSVIVTTAGNPSALAAKAVTTSIPIVFQTGADPVEAGLVASLNRPGGNLTGVTTLARELGLKQLEMIREFVPTAVTVALLVNPTSRSTAEYFSTILQAAAQSFGLKFLILQASNEEQLDSAFAELARQRLTVLIVVADAFFIGRNVEVASMANRHAIPTIFPFREFVAAGGLMSYGTSNAESYRQAGIYCSRILAGEKPADLPVQQTAKVELAINLKTAKALELTVPLPLLGRADEVIE